MKTKRILVCDGTVDGIFTAIYKAYDMRYGHENIKLVEKAAEGDELNFELFSEYIDIEKDYELSAKVGRSIRQKISSQAYESVIRAALSEETGKSDAIYRFLILGFHVGKEVMNYLSNDAVHRIFTINRNVGNEAHHMLEFLRFKEVGDGVLLAVIKPKNHVLSLITPHFADRLNNERFLIYDEGRSIAAIHEKNQEPIYMEVDGELVHALDMSKDKQADYEQLWKTFFNSICIKERVNLKLQRNNLPLRFRGNMTEFIESEKRK